MKTTAPYLIGGQKFCTLCAEKLAPRLVDRRAADSWQAFTSTNRKLPRNWGLRPGHADAEDLVD